MDVKDRIKLLMDSVKMSQQEFAKVLGITPGSLSGILNERTRPTNNHTLAVHKAFPAYTELQKDLHEYIQ